MAVPYDWSGSQEPHFVVVRRGAQLEAGYYVLLHVLTSFSLLPREV